MPLEYGSALRALKKLPPRDRLIPSAYLTVLELKGLSAFPQALVYLTKIRDYLNRECVEPDESSTALDVPTGFYGLDNALGEVVEGIADAGIFMEVYQAVKDNAPIFVTDGSATSDWHMGDDVALLLLDAHPDKFPNIRQIYATLGENDKAHFLAGWMKDVQKIDPDTLLPLASTH